MKNYSRWVVLVATLAVASLACSSLSGLLPGSSQATPTPTETPMMASSSGTDDSDQPEPDEQDPVEAEPAPELTGNDTCLVGTWRVVHESFSSYMEDAFESPAEGTVDFEFQTGRGDLFMTFGPDGTMSMSGDDFQIDMQIIGLASFTFLLQAEGSASYAADGEAVATWGTDYASSAEGGGQVLTLPEVGSQAELTLTPGDLFLYAESEGMSWTIQGAPDDAGYSPYQCSGDTLIIGQEGFQAVRWERVN